MCWDAFLLLFICLLHCFENIWEAKREREGAAQRVAVAWAGAGLLQVSPRHGAACLAWACCASWLLLSFSLIFAKCAAIVSSNIDSIRISVSYSGHTVTHRSHGCFPLSTLDSLRLWSFKFAKSVFWLCPSAPDGCWGVLPLILSLSLCWFILLVLSVQLFKSNFLQRFGLTAAALKSSFANPAIREHSEAISIDLPWCPSHCTAPWHILWGFFFFLQTGYFWKPFLVHHVLTFPSCWGLLGNLLHLWNLFPWGH